MSYGIIGNMYKGYHLEMSKKKKEEAKLEEFTYFSSNGSLDNHVSSNSSFSSFGESVIDDINIANKRS